VFSLCPTICYMRPHPQPGPYTRTPPLSPFRPEVQAHMARTHKISYPKMMPPHLCLMPTYSPPALSQLLFPSSSTMSKRRMRDITPPSEDPIDFGSETSDAETDDGQTEPINAQPDYTAPGVHPTTDTPVLPPPGSIEQVIWTSAVRARMANQTAFDADSIQPHQASTSNDHSIRPHTRSETHRLTLDRELLANNQLASYERDALQEQQVLHQEALARCVPDTLVILDLPAGRVTPNLTGRPKSQSIHTYEFRAKCTLCNEIHPQYSRGKGCFMRAFIGPLYNIPSHVMTEIPAPSTFWTHSEYRNIPLVVLVLRVICFRLHNSKNCHYA
jgi:hypothetical protein